MFSKYDVYTTIQSVYCYPDSNVLKNKLNIRDKAELCRVFDEIRTGRTLLEQNKERQIQNLSHVMAELNIIHPFREGNGRAIRELIRCMALQYGLHLNWGNTDRDTLINAAIVSVDDDTACEVLTQCLERNG